MSRWRNRHTIRRGWVIRSGSERAGILERGNSGKQAKPIQGDLDSIQFLLILSNSSIPSYRSLYSRTRRSAQSYGQAVQSVQQAIQLYSKLFAVFCFLDMPYMFRVILITAPLFSFSRLLMLPLKANFKGENYLCVWNCSMLSLFNFQLLCDWCYGLNLIYALIKFNNIFA